METQMSNEHQQNKSQTPDQIVAEVIILALQNEGLLRYSQVKTFSAKLAAGKLSAEDWSLEIELALTRMEIRE